MACGLGKSLSDAQPTEGREQGEWPSYCLDLLAWGDNLKADIIWYSYMVCVQLLV